MAAEVLPKSLSTVPDLAKLAIGLGVLFLLGQAAKRSQKVTPPCDGSISGSPCTLVGM